ncbi:hypothetical protein QYF36_005335 [Acer negundo]|nr:hypothetical protein QYF36_005335 [Acer negundo]
MASTLLRILTKTHNFTITTAPILTRTCHSHTVTAKPNRRFNNNLFSRISPLGNDTSLVPVLDKWVQEGNQLEELELQRIVRDLRSHKRYSQALQVSEWMRNSDLQFSVGVVAVTATNFCSYNYLGGWCNCDMFMLATFFGIA